MQSMPGSLKNGNCQIDVNATRDIHLFSDKVNANGNMQYVYMFPQ